MAKVSATTRWDLVALAQREELLRMSTADKLAQVGSLMASAEAMGWSARLREGDEEIWMRWQAIRARVLRRGVSRRTR